MRWERWRDAQEFESVDLGCVAKVDQGYAILGVSDDAAEVPFQPREFSSVEVAEEHGVLERVAVSFHTHMDGSETPVIRDIVRNEVSTPRQIVTSL